MAKNIKKGELKIFFGYCAGVGKTYAMLEQAQEQLLMQKDVVIGYVEPHNRAETSRLLKGIPQIPTKPFFYKKLKLEEPDIDAIIQRHPDIVLIDELAHTNANDMRNQKRYQDVEELLNCGIDVYTTLNVQHIESLNNLVENITGVKVLETIPDAIFSKADKIELIDIDPEELISRLEDGKIYHESKIGQALTNFFTKDNLQVLREIAVNKMATHISKTNDKNRMQTNKVGNTRILACIGTGPSTAKCLRWAARMSEAFGIEWSAIAVKDEELFSDTFLTDKMNENIKLAETLGAKVTIIEGYNVIDTIVEYAKNIRATSIVIGKKVKRRTFLEKFTEDFEDKLIHLLPGVEVHVISDYEQSVYQKNIHKKTLNVSQYINITWSQTFLTAFILLIATIIAIGFQQLGFEYPNFIIIYVVAIVIISRKTDGYFYGIAASLMSVILYDYYFVLPYLSLKFSSISALFTFLIMLIVAMITSGLVSKMKQQNVLLVHKQARTEQLYQLNQQLILAYDYEMIAQLVLAFLYNNFERPILIYLLDDKETGKIYTRNNNGANETTIKLTDNEQTIIKWVLQNKKQAGAGTQTFASSKYLFLPLLVGNTAQAVIGIDCLHNILEKEDHYFLQMILTQVSLAVEKQHLLSEQQQTTLLSEIEKLKNNILRSVSHDLRSPLTGILGSATTILENQTTISQKTKQQLLKNIVDESGWLIRMVENLLTVTRINEQTMRVIKTPELLEEIVSNAELNVRRRFPQREIRTNIPEEMIFIEVDAILIVQVIMNLLENAIRYSSETTKVELTVLDNKTTVEFIVTDEGSGIALNVMQNLFGLKETEVIATTDKNRGLGIGLTVCASIIKAHGGTIKVENRDSGGARVSFILPKKDVLIDES